MQIKIITISLLIYLFSMALYAKPVARLFEPVGRVEVIHNNKIYTAYDRFKLYIDDEIILHDENSTAKLLIYENGSLLYNIHGKTTLPVRQFLHLKIDNKQKLLRFNQNLR